jgi:SAM-dependent methyltransferase
VSRHDAGGPAFWEQRYRDGVTPWDAGRTPAALANFLARESPGRAVLLPGCGTGYEVQSFAAAGHDAKAIDFSPAAVARARATLGQDAHRVALADFFAEDCGAPFDLIYERAFLCALPPALWPRYAARVAALLAPRGRLVGFFFGDVGPERLPRGQRPASPGWADRHGPPFPLLAGEIDALLGERFERVEDRVVDDSIPVFANRERWQVWQRRD